MATISTYKLNGIQYQPPREWRGLEVLATFDGDSVQANITTSEFSFVNTADSKPKTAIDNWFSSLPTEGIPFSLSITNETSTYSAFNGYLDFRTMQYLSDIETKLSIKQDNGIASLDTRLRGISMLLLEQQGALTSSDYASLPYIVKNRKTLLEKVFLVAQAYATIKTGIDEVHKILNIASDFTSAGIVQATVNLGVTIVNLVVLINKLVDLLQQIQDAFFPPIRYHKGISMYKAIQKAVAYCGYGLDTGASFGSILQKTFLCPSKDDEIGETYAGAAGSGILKPKDFGYITSDLFTLANKMYFTKVAIVGSNVVIRPFNDPYWVQNSSYILPSVKIEQAFVKNGMKSINYDELNSSRIVQYITDDSDLWTLTNVGEQISVTTVKPITVNSQNRVLLTGSEQINIPYSLCVRENPVDDLFTLFVGNSEIFNNYKQIITDHFASVQSILGEAFPVLDVFIAAIPKRSGCMRVENHFFSTAKIVYLEAGRIPEDFYTIVGAKALNENYHSYKSFVAGVRNPSDPTDTNAKDVYSEVTIPMGIDNFNTLINNSYFTTNSGEIGKFTSIKWIPDKDKAVCDFYIQSNWAVNLQETTI